MLKPEKGNDGAYTGRYYEHQGLVRVAGPFRLVVGRPVFFEEHLVDAAPELERELFRDTEGKHQWGSKLSPPLHTSFVFRNRLQRDEVIVVERLKVCLFDPNGWPLHPDVHSWFEENVRLRVTVNRLDLADELVGRFVGDGYEIQPLTRHVYTVGPSPSPLDFIASDKDITGLLRVLRSPGERGAHALVRIEAHGVWLVEPKGA